MRTTRSANQVLCPGEPAKRRGCPRVRVRGDSTDRAGPADTALPSPRRCPAPTPPHEAGHHTRPARGTKVTPPSRPAWRGAAFGKAFPRGAAWAGWHARGHSEGSTWRRARRPEIRAWVSSPPMPGSHDQGEAVARAGSAAVSLSRVHVLGSPALRGEVPRANGHWLVTRSLRSLVCNTARFSRRADCGGSSRGTSRGARVEGGGIAATPVGRAQQGRWVRAARPQPLRAQWGPCEPQGPCWGATG